MYLNKQTQVKYNLLLRLHLVRCSRMVWMVHFWLDRQYIAVSTLYLPLYVISAGLRHIACCVRCDRQWLEDRCGDGLGKVSKNAQLPGLDWQLRCWSVARAAKLLNHEGQTWSLGRAAVYVHTHFHSLAHCTTSPSGRTLPTLMWAIHFSAKQIAITDKTLRHFTS